MSKRYPLWPLLSTIAAVIAVDEWGRSAARARTFLGDWGWVRFDLYWNEGFFGGDGASLSPLLNQVFLSSLSLLFIALLCLIGFLYRKDDIVGLRSGLLLFGTGLMGNVMDRIFLGRVTDWIVVRKFGIDNYAFNGADLLIGAGILILGFLLSFRSERFWRDSQIRDKILIERPFQFGLALYLVGAALTSAVIVTLASLIFFRLYLLAPDTSIGVYLGLFGGIVGFGTLVAVAAGLFHSRGLFGPVLALEALIHRALAGRATARDRAFALRQNDSFQTLGPLGREIAKRGGGDSDPENGAP